MSPKVESARLCSYDLACAKRTIHFKRSSDILFMSSGEIVMRKARFIEHQIITVLKSVEAGHTVKDVCREAAYYNWKENYGGMEDSDINEMKDLEDENRRLKQMFADLSLECRALKDIIEKSFNTSDTAGARRLSDLTIYDEHSPGMQDVIAEQDGVLLPARRPT